MPSLRTVGLPKNIGNSDRDEQQRVDCIYFYYVGVDSIYFDYVGEQDHIVQWETMKITIRHGHGMGERCFISSHSFFGLTKHEA